MTISALRKACFSVVHKQVGTCATCVHHTHKHVVPNESAVALDGYLAHTLPSSHGHPELCFRPLCENTGMKQGEVQRWGQGRGKPHPFLSLKDPGSGVWARSITGEMPDIHVSTWLHKALRVRSPQPWVEIQNNFSEMLSCFP